MRFRFVYFFETRGFHGKEKMRSRKRSALDKRENQGLFKFKQECI